jgi:hypothetical protein
MQFEGQFGTVQAAQAGIEILWFVNVLDTAPNGARPQPALFIPVRPLIGTLPELASPPPASVPLAPEPATPLPTPLAATPLSAPVDVKVPDESLPLRAPESEPTPTRAPLGLMPPLVPPLPPAFDPMALKPEPATVPVPLPPPHATAVTSATHGIVRNARIRFIGRPGWWSEASSAITEVRTDPRA